MKKSKKPKLGGFLLIVFAMIVTCVCVFLIYAQFYYRADSVAQSALISDDVVSVSYENDHMVVFSPQNPNRGVIFYPGAKVEYTAYAPLLHQLAENGFLCVVVKMPQNFAFLDVNAADKVINNHSEIDKWYIGGHSLGGAMAASYAGDNKDKIDGVILLAAYSTVDLNGMEVFSVYGSNDGVLQMIKYEEYFSNLPENTHELVIEGGNHAQFGSYGEQKNDGNAEITAEHQISQTVSFICDYY